MNRHVDVKCKIKKKKKKSFPWTKIIRFANFKKGNEMFICAFSKMPRVFYSSERMKSKP